MNKFPVNWFRCKTCGDQDWLKFYQTCFVRICGNVSSMIELFNIDIEASILNVTAVFVDFVFPSFGTLIFH